MVKEVERACAVKLQRRRYPPRLRLGLAQQLLIQILQQRRFGRFQPQRHFPVHQPYTAVNDGFLDRLQALLAAHDQLTQGQQKIRRSEKDAVLYTKQKKEKVKIIIDAMRHRRHKLEVAMHAIMDLQRPFFLEGDELLLKPMILKDVAERTGLDISTISRVSNSKYVQTNYGIYPLKWFFSDGYTTDDGQEIATRKIQNALKEIIENEDKKKPLSDEVLTQMLNQKGFPIARRTVAKYREQLGIPVARLRK